MQDAQHAPHGIVQAAVDGAEDHHALLDTRQRRPDWRVGVLIGHVVQRRAHDALAGVDQHAQKLQQHRAGRVVRQGHGQLADVVHVQAALDLQHLRGLDLERLPAARAALELEHRLRIGDVRAVEQGAQRPSRRGAEAADHVRQADGVGAAPRHERELDEPLQLLLRLVQLVPVAVDAEHLAGELVDREDVGGGLDVHVVVGVLPLKAGDGVDLVDGAQAVLVVARLAAALDLVIGLGGLGEVRVGAGRHHVHVAVHAAAHALLVVELRQVLHMRAALGAVEVRSRKGQVHVVNGREQEAGTVAVLVPAHLQVLGPAQWHLRQELLDLGAELGRLHRELPVHERRLAVGLLDPLHGDLADDEVLGGSAGGHQLLHGACRKIYAGLGHHGVHHLAGALELSSAGCVVA